MPQQRILLKTTGSPEDHFECDIKDMADDQRDRLNAWVDDQKAKGRRITEVKIHPKNA